MVADDLAVALAERHVKPGFKVLDPFCGSGRLLFAGANVPGEFVGIDVNPLACLITMAKAAAVIPSTISDIAKDIECARMGVAVGPLKLRARRKVSWFSESVRVELAQIVAWINELRLDWPERTVIATALSAATRDVSYSRKGRWKLHRLSSNARMTHTKSAWDCLRKRLDNYVTEACKAPLPQGRVTAIRGDVAKVLSPGSSRSLLSSFDLVITSPPYGDSKTTVQYGATSALCLDAVSYIDGFEDFFVPGCNIDRQCLGDDRVTSHHSEILGEIKRYWAGARGSIHAASIARFLTDFFQAFERVAPLLRVGGQVVLVLGRRSVGGFRVKLDKFTKDCLEPLGLRPTNCDRRLIRKKRLPNTINRFGRAKSEQLRAKGTTKTMSDEFVLTFEMTSRVS